MTKNECVSNLCDKASKKINACDKASKKINALVRIFPLMSLEDLDECLFFVTVWVLSISVDKSQQGSD